MKPFFKPDGLAVYESRKENHVSWYQERITDDLLNQIDLESSSETSQDTETESQEPLNVSAEPIFSSPDYDSEPDGFQPGCVRILAPELSDPLNLTPIYVLILGEWTPDWSWIVPFSNYSAPATEMELRSTEGPEPLQILQVWNARTCQDELLQQSWYVTRVNPSLVEQAKLLYSSMVSGRAIEDERLLLRMGTKILHEDDPRLIYIAEETKRLDTLSDRALALDSIRDNIVSIAFRNDPVVLAASGGSKQRELEFHVFAFENTPIRIIIAELENAPKKFSITIQNDQDNLFEGASVLSALGDTIARIQNHTAGSSSSPLDLTHERKIQFAVILADGTEVSLTPEHDS